MSMPVLDNVGLGFKAIGFGSGFIWKFWELCLKKGQWVKLPLWLCPLNSHSFHFQQIICMSKSWALMCSTTWAIQYLGTTSLVWSRTGNLMPGHILLPEKLFRYYKIDIASQNNVHFENQTKYFSLVAPYEVRIKFFHSEIDCRPHTEAHSRCPCSKGTKKVRVNEGVNGFCRPPEAKHRHPPSQNMTHLSSTMCYKKIMAWVTVHHKKITAKIYRVSIRPRAGLQPPTWAACCASTDWTKHVNWIGTIHVSLYTLLFLLVMPCSCTAWHKKWTQYSGFHTAGQGDS